MKQFESFHSSGQVYIHVDVYIQDGITNQITDKIKKKKAFRNSSSI